MNRYAAIVLLTLFAAGTCTPTTAQVAGAKFGRVPLPPQSEHARPCAKPTLGAGYWTAKYATDQPDARKWTNAWHKGIHTSWFNGSDPKVAKGYIINWGPLGIRTYMHDRTWWREKAFVERAPAVLKDSSGALYANAFEVIDVLPGSPAAGHLQPGDILVAMDGKSFLSATEMKLDPPRRIPQTRGLQLHAGLLLDQAEGQGRVEFKVLRNPKPVTPPKAEWTVLAEQKLWHQGEGWGNGEKGRKVVNDRRLWVPGTLLRDQTRWNVSFQLPSGQYISAATQGNEIMVRDKRGDWISPRDHALQTGSTGRSSILLEKI